MNIQIPLRSLPSRLVALVVLLATCVSLLYLVLSDFVVSALTDDRIAINFSAAPSAFITAPFTDDRVGINPDTLSAASSYLPNSPRLHLRLAEFETPYGKDNWKSPEFHALRAVQLSPHDYRPLLALASVQEYKENLPASEQSLRAALRLAPGSLEAHWQLGTILLQAGKLPDALPEFREASAGNPAYLRAALDLVWSASGEKPSMAAAVVPDGPTEEKNQLALANFLFQKSRLTESAAVFKQIPARALLGDRESGSYLNKLIGSGQVALAHDLWLGLVEPTNHSPEPSDNIVWNGGFESDILLDFAQFDWSIVPSNDAQISIDSSATHAGRRSLRIDFVGRETTRLDNTITQRVLVHPGARYRLSYFMKSQHLVGPDSPHVTISGIAPSAEPSDPNAQTDWQKQTLDFAPVTDAVTVSIELKPKFSYEDPTNGTVWFDDIEIREVR